MSQVRYAFSSGNVVKMALGLAAALAAMFAVMASTSSPAVANPPQQGCYGLVNVCHNPLTIGNVDLDVLSEAKILNDAEINIVKVEIKKNCVTVIGVGCLKAVVPILNDPDIKIGPKILGILIV